ncbi:hypothetical protein [Variovorax sp. LjRoot175]
MLIGFSSDLGLVMREAMHVRRAQLAFPALDHSGVHPGALAILSACGERQRIRGVRQDDHVISPCQIW